MNTPAHLIFGAAAFSKPDQKRSFLSAVLGSLAPDLSLYVMVGVSIFLLGASPQIVFREYYYSDLWQSVFAVDNSFVVWGLFLGLALWRGWKLLSIFASAALLHLSLDFPLHTHDARQHFWPLSDWVFVSPVSYWDNRAHAGVVGPLELSLSFGLAGYMLWLHQHWGVRIAVLVFLVAELLSSGIWRFVF
ncbi:MAG: cobalamin biosynthesis protein CobQ [Silicimonas sp.]|nr:cobalamin biosynthesis protein CobQ [Silicimonas sp.]